jgi:hypothetical protein
MARFGDDAIVLLCFDGDDHKKAIGTLRRFQKLYRLRFSMKTLICLP